MKKIKPYLLWLFTLLFCSSSLLAQQKNIELTSIRNEDNSIDINYTKRLPGTYTVAVEFTGISNSLERNFKKSIHGKSGRLITIKPIDKEKSISMSYSYISTLGAINPKIQSEFCYTLPLIEGTHARINQSLNLGETQFGSEKPKNWKFFNYTTEEPCNIYAMRKGIVVKIINKYETSLISNNGYTSKKNEVIIQHKDGSFASYKGFKKETILVSLGQTVYPQTNLGIIAQKTAATYGFSFGIYYISEFDYKKQKTSTLTNRNYMSTFVDPYFLTQDGVTQLTDRTYYTVEFNETQFTQEFSRKEKKKYKKDPSLFK